MKVLLISDNTSGGAGIACRRLCEALLQSREHGPQHQSTSCTVRGAAESRGQRLEDRQKDDSRVDQSIIREEDRESSSKSNELSNHPPSSCHSPLEIRWLAMSGERGTVGSEQWAVGSGEGGEERDEGGGLRPEVGKGGADHVIDPFRLDKKWIRRLAFRFASKHEKRAHWINRWKTWGLENEILRYVRDFNPDIINLHNIHLASFRLFERLPRHIKIVWTLHDMWPLTGYCVYSFGCEKYLDGCKGECPQWGKWGEVAHSPEEEWERRERAFGSRAEGGNLKLERVEGTIEARGHSSSPEGYAEVFRLRSETTAGQDASAFAGLRRDRSLREDSSQRIEDRGERGDHRQGGGGEGNTQTPKYPSTQSSEEVQQWAGNESSSSLVFVAPSKWMAECARKRFGGRVSVEHIPYGLPLDVFRPMERGSAREKLGLPLDKKIILAGSASLSEERKGLRYLVEAMERLGGSIEHRAESIEGREKKIEDSSQRIACPAEPRRSREDSEKTLDLRPQAIDVVQGSVSSKQSSVSSEQSGRKRDDDLMIGVDDPYELADLRINEFSIPSGGMEICLVTFGATAPVLSGNTFQHIHVGSISDEQVLSQYYASADVYVLPTLADNLPNTLLEAMACGTPCISFDVGGCRDIVFDGVNGRLAKAGEVPELSSAILSILSMSPADALCMRHAARKIAEDGFTAPKQAAAYRVLL